MQTHVKRTFQLDEKQYDALSKDEKRVRKLDLLQVVADLCRLPTHAYQSPLQYHEWIASERARLCIDDAVGNWGDKPLLYHLKAHPDRFVRSMCLMSRDNETSGGAAFALYPLRRSFVPKHIRFDQKGLRDLLHIGLSNFIKKKAKKRRLGKSMPSITIVWVACGAASAMDPRDQCGRLRFGEAQSCGLAGTWTGIPYICIFSPYHCTYVEEPCQSSTSA